MYTAKVTSKGQITLPKEVRVALKIEEGERVLITPDPESNGFFFSNIAMVSLGKGMKIEDKNEKGGTSVQEE